MFQSFTGNSRRPRQVNLSGRHGSAPASKPGRATATVGVGTQATLAHAQQERQLRQQERARLEAVKRIQRVWRGYEDRTQMGITWRYLWDSIQGNGCDEQYTRAVNGPLADLADLEREPLPLIPPDPNAPMEVAILLRFVDVRMRTDFQRFQWFVLRLLWTAQMTPTTLEGDEWRWPLWRVGKVSLEALKTPGLPKESVRIHLLFQIYVTTRLPKEMAKNSERYYVVLSTLTVTNKAFSESDGGLSLLIQSVLAPLQSFTSETITAYEGFVRRYLTIPYLEKYLGSLDALFAGVNYKILVSTLAVFLQNLAVDEGKSGLEEEGLLWLLGYFVALHRFVHHGLSDNAPDPDYIAVVSLLISLLADVISKRIDTDDNSMAMSSNEEEDDDSIIRHEGMKQNRRPLPAFVRENILSLVNQKSVTSLLIHANALSLIGDKDEEGSSEHELNSEANVLAGYALNLLRIFPRRSDEIRMWLYLGSTVASKESNKRLPAIKFFWEASRRTGVFEMISSDPRAAVSLIKFDTGAFTDRQSHTTYDADELNQDWRVILIFFELYSFVLKVMDDDEFFSQNSTLSGGRDGQEAPSWTRESALPLEDVKELTIFMKNLAFAMYWSASELKQSNETDHAEGIREYFNPRASAVPKPSQNSASPLVKNRTIGGVTEMTVDYVKGIVTGLLRMVYERDSRRPFLPKDHWLMTTRFNMSDFIPAVVAEEENRHLLQREEDEDEDIDEDEDVMDVVTERTNGLIGTQRAQRSRALELLKRQQRRRSRRNYLEAVTPRLEILQNMPFFIPFATRVQIFRQFVLLDQHRRREGFVDPDQWRMAVVRRSVLTQDSDGLAQGHDVVSKHHAKIRRESVFDDAYEQYYGLGEGLKEPIQITFVDRFDTVEAGIDGGGVTKEFLTSITNEAFSSPTGIKFFVENDQNLLYPNPSAVDERKDLLRVAGVREGSTEWNDQIRDLLRRYEFLGRVIGKCLYEGILVDVGFAGFFLLKWALTGGSGSASKESGYRANLNDVRDLDEELYQGLLKLKNYPGNVEDFSLNFTITDTISSPAASERGGGHITTRTITRELKPNGSNIPVTNENRLVYISYVARHRLSIQPHLQTNAFLRGLGQIIQPSWLSMFNQAELQTLVGGASSEIDVPDLRQNTLYGGIYSIGDDRQEHTTVKLFWDVMQSFSDSDRRKVLKFVTSTPRAPLLGFGQLNPRFSIRDAGSEQDRLPSTSTCVNLLKLPRYANASTLREKLLYAVNSGAGFDLS